MNFLSPSSSNSGSIGRRNGRISSKLIAGLRFDGKPNGSLGFHEEMEEAYATSPSGVASSCPCSSARDFSARSSFRIVPTRISQIRCSVSVFLLVYSRLRSSPSTCRCAPLVSVLANSESLPKTTQRCHSVCETYWLVFLSL